MNPTEQTSQNQLLQEALSGGPDAQRSLREFLASHPDPRIRLFSEWAGRLQTDAPDDANTVDVEAVEVLEETPVERPERRRLFRRMRRLERELRFQREIGDTLAAALGACYLCWGDDDSCEECGGQGLPGWQSPDEELFKAYVVPAVRRVQQVRKASHPRGTRDSQTSPSDIADERKPS